MVVYFTTRKREEGGMAKENTPDNPCLAALLLRVVCGRKVVVAREELQGFRE
jgi:hypothetical protein